MNKKFKKEISDIFLNMDIAVGIILALLLFWFNLWIGIGSVFILGGLVIYHRIYSNNKLERKLEEYKEEIIKNKESLLESFEKDAPIMVCMIDKSLELQWTNPKFDEVFETKAEFTKYVSKEKLEEIYELSSSDSYYINIDEKTFEINTGDIAYSVPGYKLVFWRDISENIKNKKKLEESKLSIAFINIDNLDEILQDTAIENRSMIVAQIDEVIFDWASELLAALYKIESDKYILLVKNKEIEKEKNKGFRVLQRVRSIETEADFPTSISVGIGLFEDNLEDLQKSAMQALELALGRGGDQVVIRKANAEIEYYGGTLPTVEKRNKGKSRVMVHALMNLINDCDKVFVLGHSHPDMDAYGAVIGINALARNLNKECKIILEAVDESIEEIYYAVTNDTEDDKHKIEYINHEESLEQLTEKSLLVMVDHHIAAISEYPEIIEKASKLAVIDHHRKSSDAVEEKLLSFTEPYASSTCELITEMLQYAGKNGEISRIEAEALLCGITLDTKNFTANTGARTFDAASYLRRKGADNNNIVNYFKMDLSSYQKKLNVMANAEILSGGVAVSYTKESDDSIQIIVSQAADELLKMKGVDAAIVAGPNGKETMVSARSNGQYNVQVLMEKLGGGGHQRAAAVQLDESPEEAINRIVALLREEGIVKEV